MTDACPAAGEAETTGGETSAVARANAPRGWRRVLVLVAPLLLAGAITLAYRNTFSVPFLLDDITSIQQSQSIRHLTSAWHPPANSLLGNRPVLNFSFAVNYAVGGYSLPGYHVVNLLIHVMAVLAAMGLVRRTCELPVWGEQLRRRSGAIGFAAALVWGLHPVLTESVTYLSQRAESLAGLFYLLTIHSFVRSVASPRPLRWRILAVVTCLLGVLTKETVATAPLMVYLYDVFFISHSWGKAWRERRGFYLALAGPLLVMLVLMAGVRDRGVGFDPAMGALKYAWISLWSIGRYAQLAVVPTPLIFDYGWEPVFTGAWSLRLLAAAVMAITVWGFVRRNPAAFLGGWFLLILVPSTSVIPLASQCTAENRMYLSTLGVAVLGVVAAFRYLGRFGWVVVLALALSWGWSSYQRNQCYGTALSLWNDTMVKVPANCRPHYFRGTILAEEPQTMEQAIAEVREALRLRPVWVEAHVTLGNLLYKAHTADRTECLAEYEKALELKPNFPAVHFNLANALAKIPGRKADAIAHVRTALEQEPNYRDAHFLLGNLLAGEAGKAVEAVSHYREVLRLSPNFVLAHYNLAVLLSKNPDTAEEALAHFKEAIRISPTYMEAHYNLGLMYSHMPQHEKEAREEFRTVLKLDPGSRNAQLMLYLIDHPELRNGS